MELNKEQLRRLADCKYYKGDDNIPDNTGDNPFFVLFWLAESAYVLNKPDVEGIKMALQYGLGGYFINIPLPIIAYTFELYTKDRGDLDRAAITFIRDVLPNY